jgi:hypothetical protein
MRTTVDIPDQTYRKLKSKSVEQGCTVKELILRGIQRELGEGKRKKGRIRLPIIRSKKPGALRLTNEQICEIIEFP